MTVTTYQTSLGEIPVHGTLTQRPKVLAITGFNASAEDFVRLPLLVEPDYDGLVAFLPGNRSPLLSETSIAAFATAFDEVVDRLGPTLVLGSSIGALVALGMRSPAIMRVIAIEPPLVMSKVWPMSKVLREHYAKAPEQIEAVFGVTPAAAVERDYRGLLDGLHRPTDVVVGAEPLFPVRECLALPSLVDEPERLLLAAHPAITVHVAPKTGHDVPRAGARTLLAVLKAALGDQPPAPLP